MQDSEILIPKTQLFKLGNREYSIGRLKMTQRILLIRIIMECVYGDIDNLRKLQKATERTNNNLADLVAITGMLNPESYLNFFGVILDEKDMLYLNTYLDETKSSEIIAIICETNEFKFEDLKKNIQRIKAIFSLRKEKKAV